MQTAIVNANFPTFLHHTFSNFKGKLMWKGNPYFQLQSGSEKCLQQQQTTRTVCFCCASLPLRLNFGELFRDFTFFGLRVSGK